MGRLSPHLSSIDVVAVAILIEPLSGLVFDVGILTDKSTDVLACGGGIQATDVKPTIGFNISNGGRVGNKNNSAIIVLVDGSLCVGHSGQSSGSSNHSSISFSFGKLIIAYLNEFVKRVSLFLCGIFSSLDSF